MIIAGIDYSMSCPSLCIFDTELDFTFQNCEFYYLIDKKTKIIEEGNIHGEYYSKDSENVKRFDHISDWAITILKNQKVNHVYLEGYSMGSRGRVFHIAENTGVLKQKIYKAGITFEVIPPSTWKKEVVGKGNADKQHVYESMNVDLKPIFKSKSITSPINDIADSYFICKYGSLTFVSK
jgi:Holliday junction resolvasome RuvABC endonuclease subunit